MESINPDLASHAIVIDFLTILMKTERERLNLTRKQASQQSKWPDATWGELESKSRTMQAQHWMAAVRVISLSPVDIVKALDRYIENHPSVWMEKNDDEYRFCERQVTSPRALRSGNTVNVDLNRLRPALFYELSTYSPNPGEIIEQATLLGLFAARELTLPPQTLAPGSGGGLTEMERRARVARIIHELSEEKFGLLERVVDKFERFSAKELAYAYQHFSLSVSKH